MCGTADSYTHTLTHTFQGFGDGGSGGGGGGASLVYFGATGGELVVAASGGGGGGASDYCCAHGGHGGSVNGSAGSSASTTTPVDNSLGDPRNEYNDERDETGLPAYHQHMDLGGAPHGDTMVLASGGGGGVFIFVSLSFHTSATRQH